jgi:hypothetical protein
MIRLEDIRLIPLELSKIPSLRDFREFRLDRGQLRRKSPPQI